MRFAADALSAALAGCLLALGAAAQDRGSVQLLVQSSPLAGFRYHRAASVWPELNLGDELQLVREADNRHDANALRVEWRGHVLGYVPRRENAALAWGLDRGVVLRARISRLEWHPNPARRVEFEVFVE